MTKEKKLMGGGNSLNHNKLYKINLTISFEECKELVELLECLEEEKISKYQACKLVNCSRATFDNLVKAGKLPRGRKQAGFKELFWRRSEIEKFLQKNLQE